MKHIYLVESGIIKNDCRDFIRAFEDETEAWYVILKRYKNYNLDRNNRFKKKGFRGILYSKNRWVSVTRIKLMNKKIQKTQRIVRYKKS